MILPLIGMLLQLSQAFAFHVVIDPGHGGNDTGAEQNQLKESQIVLEVSKKLASLLEKNSAFKVSLTRKSETFLALESRTEFANSARADLFLSIHVNWNENKSVRGREIYFQNQLPPDEESLFLASRENQGKKVVGPDRSVSSAQDIDAIIADLKRNTRIRESGELSRQIDRAWPADENVSRSRHKKTVRQAPFFVISNLNMPSALIELGYISNPEEGAKLTQAAFQEKLAQALYVGILNYKELVDKTARQSLN